MRKAMNRFKHLLSFDFDSIISKVPQRNLFRRMYGDEIVLSSNPPASRSTIDW